MIRLPLCADPSLLGEKMEAAAAAAASHLGAALLGSQSSSMTSCLIELLRIRNSNQVSSVQDHFLQLKMNLHLVFQSIFETLVLGDLVNPFLYFPLRKLVGKFILPLVPALRRGVGRASIVRSHPREWPRLR